MSHSPFRFYCPVGESKDVIVVDNEPDFFRHEHSLKGQDGKWNVFCSCIADHANCPVCLSGPEKPAYFALYLTVIDLTPYTNKEGIAVPWSKKLLVVKSSQQKKFTRLFNQHGSLRGMVLQMTRDGEKDAAIGNDIECVGFVDEDGLETYYHVYQDKQNKDVEVIGGEPFNYDEIFPAQTEEMLASFVGGTVNNYGSHARNIGMSSRGRAAPNSSGDSWQSSRAPAPAARPAVRSAARPAMRPAPGGEQDDQGSYENEPAAEAPRVAGRHAPTAARPAPRAAAPAPRTAVRPAARAPEQDPADEVGPGDEVYDEPPQRQARPLARPAPREAAPSTSLAARRQQLRR